MQAMNIAKIVQLKIELTKLENNIRSDNCAIENRANEFRD